MSYKVTLIPGDGIGPEVIGAAKACLDATGVNFDWQIVEIKNGDLTQAISSIRKNKVALKGPTTTPIGAGRQSLNVQLRKELDLFANLRPAKTYAGVRSKYQNVDLVVIRENLEDLYFGLEFGVGEGQKISPKIPKDAAVSLKVISKKGAKRIIDFAFDYALKNKRKKLTVIHKANILKETDGLFLRVAREIAQGYPKIVFEEILVDNMAAHLVTRPGDYDILVCPNLYGDILSDLCAGLVGGLGLAPSANIGEYFAVFEPVHGSAPKYTGLNKVNPTAAILSGVLLLRHLKEEKAADRLEEAVATVIAEGKFVTYDFKEDRNDPTAVGTLEMAQAIINKLK